MEISRRDSGPPVPPLRGLRSRTIPHRGFTVAHRLSVKNQLLVALVIVAATGCRSSLQDIDPKKFSFEVQEVQPRASLAFPISASTIEADTTLRVRNDNTVRVKLDGADFELLINDRRALLGSTTERIDVPAQGSGFLHLHAQATGEQLRDLISLIRDRSPGSEPRFTVRGTAHYRTFLGVTIDIPFSADAKSIVH